MVLGLISARPSKISSLRLTWLGPPFSVCRLSSADPVPEWATKTGAFFGAVRTADEVSIVCEEQLVPSGVRHEGPFRALKVEGPLDFALVGVLSSLLAPIADAGISVFVVSTFDTDYVFVPAGDTDRTAQALSARGHSIG